MKEIQNSGYNNGIFAQYLTSALIGFEHKMERIRNSEIPFHRKGVNIQRSNIFKKLDGKSRWDEHQNNRGRNMFVKYGQSEWGNKHISQKIQQETLDAPVFVPRTPGRKLG